MSDALLEVEDLHVTFHTASGPVHAVDGVSFTMASGAALGVVGESGSGKSVTARAILRLFAITDDVEIAGSVRFAGVDLLRIDERKLRRVRGGQIGMIFQDPLTSLNPLMMVGEQIAECRCACTAAWVGPRPPPKRWHCSGASASAIPRGAPRSCPTASAEACASG